ncbi:hypothetical protein vseg_005958 [Gypsophila vaccaria]
MSKIKVQSSQILHNVAIVEFLRDGCSDPMKLVDVLIDVKVVSMKSSDVKSSCSGGIGSLTRKRLSSDSDLKLHIRGRNQRCPRINKDNHM